MLAVEEPEIGSDTSEKTTLEEYLIRVHTRARERLCPRSITVETALD